jgi:hypothetical protein
MCFNPPESRDLIKDTLFCMGIPYEYEKIKQPTRHIYFFELDRDNTVEIYSPTYMKLNRKTYKSVPELQRAIIQTYADLL